VISGAARAFSRSSVFLLPRIGQLGIGNLPGEKWPAQNPHDIQRILLGDERIGFSGSAFGRGDARWPSDGAMAIVRVPCIGLPATVVQDEKSPTLIACSCDCIAIRHAKPGWPLRNPRGINHGSK